MPKTGFLADLFCNVKNTHWELARVLSAWAVISTSAIAFYKLFQGQELELTSYATAMMTVLGGSAVFIGLKDGVRSHAEKHSGE